MDTFDYKPKLSAKSGSPGTRPGTKLLGSKWNFAQHGQSGLWSSELFPNVANHADELCLLRSMQTDLPAHPQAFLQMHTGSDNRPIASAQIRNLKSPLNTTASQKWRHAKPPMQVVH